MKNIWFIIIGILVGFFALFILTDTWNFNAFMQKKKQPNIQNKTIPKAVHIPKHTKTIQEDTSTAIKETMNDSNLSTNTPPEKMTEPEDTDIEKIYKEEMQEETREKTTIHTKQHISKTQSINMTNAQKVKMKIKAKEKGGIVKAKVAISHDMLTYLQAKKKGKQTHFITHITAKVEERTVYDASTTQFLSKNPLIKFSFQGKKGEMLTVLYKQITGEVFYASKKIK